MDSLKIYESFLIKTSKEKEKSKQKFIEKCRERGMSEEEIQRRCELIHEIVKESIDDKLDEVFRKW